MCHISACTSISIENQGNRDSQIHPSSCTVRKKVIIKLRHMSRVTCHCYMIVALCKLNKDDFESNIILSRLIQLLYIEIYIDSHGVSCEIRTYFLRLISLGAHTIFLSYNPEPTIPGVSYAQYHTCSYPTCFRLFLNSPSVFFQFI